MGVVLDLVAYRNRETIATLESALTMARSGTLRDVAMCFRDENGSERVVFTGGYRDSTINAAKAATAMLWRVTQHEVLEGGTPC